MLDPLSVLIGSAGTLVSVLGLTWLILRGKARRDPFGKNGADEG
ncbi:DUF2781 domain-containing protein [Acetobacter aceti]|uniref:Uncharacterized protein n=1 Tax=Acetobacter aceti TaxID=435 RepID=A0A6S6PMQ9_ACEAC|nr:DUF2781 domain-containing protein [Acetobacter aceti]BCI68046.1 hypothetical protein AAJCM20276_26700 [Acetobacter aceti]